MPVRINNPIPTLSSLGGASANDAFVTIGHPADLPNSRAITGTTNQVIVTDNGAGSTVVLSTPQNIDTAANVVFGTIVVNGYSQIGVINSQTTPNTQGNGGFGTLWNYSGGSGEQAIFNQFNGPGFTAGFRFFQGTGVNTYSELAWLSWSGGNSGLKLTAGNSFITMNDWTLQRDGTSRVDANGHFGVSTFDWTSLSANESGLSSGINFNPASASTGRVWGLFFGASGSGSSNLTDSLAINGLEGNASYNGTATCGGCTGGIMYAINSSSGILSEGQGLKILANVNAGTGHMTLCEGIQVHTYGPAFSANSQTRIGILFPNLNQDPGSFTGCTSLKIWFSSDSTTTRDGIGWGSANDTIIYRGAAAQLNVTGAILGSSSITATTTIVAGTTGTFPTSVTTPIVLSTTTLLVHALDSGSSAGSATTVRGGNGGGLSAAAGALLILKGGNAGGSIGNAAGGNITLQGGTKLGSGTPGNVTIFKTDGTTIIATFDDTNGVTFTNPLTVPNGGSGAATLTGVLIGNGASAFTTKTNPSGAFVGDTDTQTLTNKRITKRTGTVASSGTPTINTDNVDFYSITALAVNITSFTTNLSGTPTEAQTLWIAITDNGTARSITWGASFEASTIALPTTTVLSVRLDVGFVWNTVTTKWRCVAVA